MISTKNSIGTSPFHLMYGTEVIFPTSLAILVMKFMKEQEDEPNRIQRRINHLIKVQEMREDVYNRSHHFQDRMKIFF